MPTHVWPDGIGQATGDLLVVNQPLTTPGTVWFVSYATGADANNGRSAEGPKKTLAAAITAASNGDIIVLLSDHDETVTAPITVNKEVTIVGAGTSAGKPAAKLKNDTGGILLQVDANGVQLRNIYFPANVQAGSQHVLLSNGPNLGFVMSGCYLECGNTLVGVESVVSSAHATENVLRFENCTWVSTATAYATRPGQALRLLDVVDTFIVGCTFDGGTYGFSGSGPSIDGVALSVSNSSGTCERLRIQSLTLLRGADVFILSTVTGYVVDVTTTGSARVSW